LVSTKSFDSSSDVVTFDNISVTVAAWATKTLVIKWDISSSLTAVNYIALDIPTANLTTYITSEDKDGRSVDEATGTNFPNITAASTAKTLLTMSNVWGTLTLSKSADTPTSSLVMMGTVKKEVLRTKLTATTEDFRIERMSFINDASTNTSGDNDNNISKVYMEYPTASGTTTVEGTLNGWIITFDITSAPAIVVKDTDATVKVYADFNTYSGWATSSEMPSFYVNLADFKAYGQGSNVMKEGNGVVLGTIKDDTTNAGTIAATVGEIASVIAATAFGFGAANGSEVNNVANITATATAMAVNWATNYKIGDLILVGTEQMIVTANLDAAGDLSVLRWANGTTAAATATVLNADVITAVSRWDLLVIGGNDASKEVAIITSNQVVAANIILSTVARSTTTNSKLTWVVSSAPANWVDLYKVTNYRPVSGNTFSVARSNATVSVAAGSASGTATTKAKDNALTLTVTNGGTFASTLSAMTLKIAGGLIVGAWVGDEAVTASIYDSAALDDSSLVGTVALTAVDAGTSDTVAASFTKTVEVWANSAKTLYVVIDTTDTDFATTISDDLLTVSVPSYSWSDGVATFVASDAGYGLTVPVNGNTLRY